MSKLTLSSGHRWPPIPKDSRPLGRSCTEGTLVFGCDSRARGPPPSSYGDHLTGCIDGLSRFNLLHYF